MQIDQQVQAYLDMLASAGDPPQYTMSVEDAREEFLGLAALAGEPLVVGSVENREVPGPESQIPARIYTPEGKPFQAFFSSRFWPIRGYPRLVAYTMYLFLSREEFRSPYPAMKKGTTRGHRCPSPGGRLFMVHMPQAPPWFSHVMRQLLGEHILL